MLVLYMHVCRYINSLLCCPELNPSRLSYVPSCIHHSGCVKVTTRVGEERAIQIIHSNYVSSTLISITFLFLRSQGDKRCEFSGSGQEMAVMIDY